MGRDIHQGNLEQLSFALVRVSYKLLGGDRMTLSYGTNVAIHGSEIHMVCHIKKNPGSHISGIARDIKVSRGAVSQIVKKVEQKGLVRKIENPNDQRQLNLILTEKGEKAYEGHQLLHRLFTDNLERVLENYDEKDFNLILRFIRDLEGSVDQLVDTVYAEDFFERE